MVSPLVAAAAAAATDDSSGLHASADAGSGEGDWNPFDGSAATEAGEGSLHEGAINNEQRGGVSESESESVAEPESESESESDLIDTRTESQRRRRLGGANAASGSAGASAAPMDGRPAYHPPGLADFDSEDPLQCDAPYRSDGSQSSSSARGRAAHIALRSPCLARGPAVAADDVASRLMRMGGGESARAQRWVSRATAVGAIGAPKHKHVRFLVVEAWEAAREGRRAAWYGAARQLGIDISSGTSDGARTRAWMLRWLPDASTGSISGSGSSSTMAAGGGSASPAGHIGAAQASAAAKPLSGSDAPAGRVPAPGAPALLAGPVWPWLEQRPWAAEPGVAAAGAVLLLRLWQEGPPELCAGAALSLSRAWCYEAGRTWRVQAHRIAAQCPRGWPVDPVDAARLGAARFAARVCGTAGRVAEALGCLTSAFATVAELPEAFGAWGNGETAGEGGGGGGGEGEGV